MLTKTFTFDTHQINVLFTGKGFNLNSFRDLGFAQPWLLNQIHSDQIIQIENDSIMDPGSRPGMTGKQGDGLLTSSRTPIRDPYMTREGDGLVTSLPNICLGIKTADCVPILLFHPNGTLAAVHAGWRGSAQQIVKQCVEKYFAASSRDKIKAMIGPAICAKHYEVGKEVADLFKPYPDVLNAGKENKFYLNLGRVNEHQLLQAGLTLPNIETIPHCTFELAELYYSFRRDGASNERNYAIVMKKTLTKA